MDQAALPDAKPANALALYAGRAACALWHQRLRPLWLLSAALLLIFEGFRAGLLVTYHAALADASVADIARCMFIGLRFDAMPTAVFAVPLAIAMLLATQRALEGRTFRRWVTVYCTFVIVLAIAWEVGGTAFFLQFGQRINYISLEYLGHFQEPAIFIATQYPLWTALAVLVLACMAVAIGLRRTLWRDGSPPPLAAPLRVAILAAVLAVCVYVSRGGIGEKPLHQGPAYFSANNVIVQLTFNNAYTFYQACRLHLNDYQDEVTWYNFPACAQRRELAASMVAAPGDSPPAIAGNPLWRLSDSGRRRHDWNVVLFVMESMSGSPVGALGNAPSYTPNFDAICGEGLFCERMYAVGARTARGLMGSVCGHPDLAGRSVLKQDRAIGHFATLPAVMRQRGYRTLFVYGGDGDFDNMKAFFTSNGIDEFLDQQDMGVAPELVPNWGVYDHIMLRRAHERFAAMGDRPFFAVVLTVSNHEPYQVPRDRTRLLTGDDKPTRKLNGFIYSDWALADFFAHARTSDYFNHTIFVMVADHGQSLDQHRVLDVPGYRVPCVFYAPGLPPDEAPRGRVKAVCTQADIPPTILGLLGGQYEHCFMGRDVLGKAQTEGFALLHEDDRLAMVYSAPPGPTEGDALRTLAVVIPPRAAPLMFQIGPRSMDLLPGCDAAAVERALAYYGTARRLYLDVEYRRPD